MTELTFLVDLLLNHNLAKETKDVIASRIKDVEQAIQTQSMQVTWNRPQPVAVPQGPQQSASTLALMAKHGDLPPVPMAVPTSAPEPVAVVAHTPATAAAMNARAAALGGDKMSRELFKAKPKPPPP